MYSKRATHDSINFLAMSSLLFHLFAMMAIFLESCLRGTFGYKFSIQEQRCRSPKTPVSLPSEMLRETYSRNRQKSKYINVISLSRTAIRPLGPGENFRESLLLQFISFRIATRHVKQIVQRFSTHFSYEIESSWHFSRNSIEFRVILHEIK